MERAMGIEPTSKAWEALILPLNYARSVGNDSIAVWRATRTAKYSLTMAVWRTSASALVLHSIDLVIPRDLRPLLRASDRRRGAS